MKTSRSSVHKNPLPPGLWAVSWVSFFWSASSLMIFSVLPIFLTEVLQTSHTSFGILEGVANSMAFLSKLLAGIVSDCFRTRKPLILFGSFLTVVIKLLFAASTTFIWIFVARALDRLSKGIRSSPTDALIADLTPPHQRGKSYGMRQSIYTLGAAFGSCFSIACMYGSNHNYRLIFALSIIPALLAFIILFFYVPQPPIQNEIKKKNEPWAWRDIFLLPKSFWTLLLVSFILMLARFSESFVTLRAKSLGWPLALLPVTLVMMEIVHAAIAYPVGRHADRSSKPVLLFWGILLLVAADALFFMATSLWQVTLAILLVGLHMGMTQSLLAALVSESTPAELRGTAFGMYYLSSGLAVLLGNSLSGHLADVLGLSGPFLAGFCFTSLASLLLLRILRKGGSLSWQRDMIKRSS